MNPLGPPPKIVMSTAPVTKAQLACRYSRGRESVINLFGKIKPDQVNSLFLSTKKEPVKEIKNTLLSNLTNEQLFDVKFFQILVYIIKDSYKYPAKAFLFKKY